MAQKPTFNQGIQLNHCWNELQAKLSRKSAQNLVERFDIIRAVAAGRPHPDTLREQIVLGDPFHVIVDYRNSHKEMIDAGNYDEVGAIDFTRFPISRSGKCKVRRTLRLFQFDRGIRSKEVVARFHKHKCRPADFAELLAFGAQCGKTKLQHAIIGFKEFTTYIIAAPKDTCNQSAISLPAIYFDIEMGGMHLSIVSDHYNNDWSIYSLFLASEE